jgi:hypothetical protein
MRWDVECLDDMCGGRRATDVSDRSPGRSVSYGIGRNGLGEGG